MRLDQVVANLLGNASKFTRKGGKIWLTLGVEEAKKDRPDSAVIRIRDNGAGIETSLLPRIFDLFVQSDQTEEENTRTRTRSGIGIGLGLTLAKRLTELHDGTIEAFSAGPGMGSEFTVRLPLMVPPSAQPELIRTAKKPRRKARDEAPMEAATSGEPTRILVVDDNADSADSMRMLLEQAGHEVVVVRDGDGVTEHALRFQPRAILLDIGLPDTDGYTVARELRKERALDEVLIIAVTGYGGDDHKKRSHDAGIDEHMTKPVDLDRLLERIAQGRRNDRA
jgi:CheY-like chemotaxis protein